MPTLSDSWRAVRTRRGPQGSTGPRTATVGDLRRLGCPGCGAFRAERGAVRQTISIAGSLRQPSARRLASGRPSGRSGAWGDRPETYRQRTSGSGGIRARRFWSASPLRLGGHRDEGGRGVLVGSACGGLRRPAHRRGRRDLHLLMRVDARTLPCGARTTASGVCVGVRGVRRCRTRAGLENVRAVVEAVGLPRFEVGKTVWAWMGVARPLPDGGDPNRGGRLPDGAPLPGLRPPSA